MVRLGMPTSCVRELMIILHDLLLLVFLKVCLILNLFSTEFHSNLLRSTCYNYNLLENSPKKARALIG